MKSLTMFRVEVLLSQISIFILISIFHVKCRPTVTLQSIGGFGLNFLNLTPLIQNPGSATASCRTSCQASHSQIHVFKYVYVYISVSALAFYICKNCACMYIMYMHMCISVQCTYICVYIYLNICMYDAYVYINA